MEHSLLFEICGWVATVGMILGYLPQAIQTIRTRQTDGISLTGFMMMAVGSIAFFIQGIISSNYYLLFTNLITSTCSSIICCIKIYNDYFKKNNNANDNVNDNL